MSAAKADVKVLDDIQKLDVELLLITSHQASNFNHSKQRNIEYIFVAFLTIFICLFAANYHLIKTVHPPPWFFLVKFSIKSRLSGWKESNLLYKAKLTYPN